MKACSNCGKELENALADDEMYLCNSCYNKYYTRCTECNDFIDKNFIYHVEESEDPFCKDCVAKKEIKEIFETLLSGSDIAIKVYDGVVMGLNKVEQEIIKDALENVVYPDGCPEGEIAEYIIQRIENQS